MRSLFIYIFLLLIVTNIEAAETLMRVSFWVPVERMAQFETVYEAQVHPILLQHGFKSSSKIGRASVRGVFSRLFEDLSPDYLADRLARLETDPVWQALLIELGNKFKSPGQFSAQIHYHLAVYETPSGSGRTRQAGLGTAVPVGPGIGLWRSYRVADGLSNASISEIIQAQDGFLYFGTAGGISRFDGESFVSITTQDGLGNNTVGAVFQDREGVFWFGNWGGVTRYDPEAEERWTTFNTSDGLVHETVSEIFQDRNDNLWIGTDSGISRINSSGNAGKPVFENFYSHQHLAGDYVFSILQDQRDDVWIATFEGVSRYDGETFTTYTTKNGLAHNDVREIIEDCKGNLWFATAGGATRYNPLEHSWATLTTQDGLVHNHVRSVFEDRDGNIWFGTQEGVSKYDGKHFTNFTVQDGLVHNRVNWILEDRAGDLWFGTHGGITRYRPRLFTTFTTDDGLGSNTILSMCQDQKGNIWFGTDSGATRYDGETFTLFTTEDGLAHNLVQSIVEDRNGAIWFGTDAGISRYDGAIFTTFTTADGLAHNEIRSLLEDMDGNLWAATWYGRSASRFDGVQWATFSPADGLPYRKLWSMIQDWEGNFWFATNHGGVCAYNPVDENFSTFTIQDGLIGDLAVVLLEDHDRNIWIGTRDGVSCFDGQAFRSFTNRDGLAHNDVRSLLQDRYGHIWFGTFGGGVSRFNGAVFQTLTTEDGLADNRVLSMIEDRDGNIWFGTQGGVTRFEPPEPSPPLISVSAVVADRHYNRPDSIAMSSSIPLIAFEIQGISFKTRPEAMCFQYRLVGYQEEWHTTHNHRIEFQNLSTGEYTFEVLAIDRDLVASEKPARVVLRVHLPYERIGGTSLLGLAMIAIVWQSVRVIRRDRRLRQSNTELRHEIAERERAERERVDLDTRLQNLDYLYRLRSDLSDARSAEAICRIAGRSLMEVLSASDSGGARIEYNGRVWNFGNVGGNGEVVYVRGLSWGGNERGQLSLFCSVALNEVQEKALLDETAGQLTRTLEARELEAQLLQSARLVSLGEMAAGVAHELNQPLTAISTLASSIAYRLLNGPELPPDQLKNRIQNIQDVIDRMAQTIDHLRVFSRDTSNESGVLFSINDAVESSLEMVRRQLVNHGIKLALDLADSLPELGGYPHQLEQVFLNLLANARDALNEKGNGYDKKIHVVTKLGTGGHVVVEVSDNGVGIDAKDVNRIFEPFFTTKDADRGTGLGLSISYAIVKDHGGELICESVVSEGTQFRLVLPAKGSV